MRRSDCAVPRVAMISKPRSCSRLAIPMAAGLSPSATVMNTVPSSGSCAPAAAWALANAVGKSRGDPHHLAGRAHLGPEQRVGAGEAVERQHRLLDADVAARRSARAGPRSAIRSPSMIRQASLASGRPIALETNGTVREARGLASITYRRSSPRIANWTLSSPTTPSALAIPLVCSRIWSSMSRAERVGRQHAGRVAGVDPGLLDVLHDPGDPHLLAVAQRVDVDLDRVLEEAVEVDRAWLVGVGADALQVVAQARRRRRRSPSRGRRARSWGARAAGSRRRARRPAPPRRWWRWRRAARCSRGGRAARPNRPAVLGQVDGVDAGAEDRDPGGAPGRRRA